MADVFSTEGGPIPRLLHQRLRKLKSALGRSVSKMFWQLFESQVSAIKRSSSGKTDAILAASLYQGHVLVLVL